MEKLYLIMPAYNEAANIENVVEDWYGILEGKSPDSRMVIADGGSTDNTLEILNNLKNTHPQLEVISKPNTDHGTKMWFLYDYAINNGADWIFHTDSDGQTNPAEFEQFWQLRNEYDAIIGNRTKRGDGAIRKFVEDVLCIILFIYFGAKIPDSGAPFRLMKPSLVKKYLYKLPSDYILPNAMLCAYFSHYHENVKYIPISFKPRQGGVNNINIKKIVQIGFQSLKDFAKLRREL